MQAANPDKVVLTPEMFVLPSDTLMRKSSQVFRKSGRPKASQTANPTPRQKTDHLSKKRTAASPAKSNQAAVKRRMSTRSRKSNIWSKADSALERFFGKKDKSE